MLAKNTLVSKYSLSGVNLVRDKNAVLDIGVQYTFSIPHTVKAGDIAVIYFPENHDVVRTCQTWDSTKIKCFGFPEFRMIVVEVKTTDAVTNPYLIKLNNIVNGFYRQALDHYYYLEYY